MNKYRIGAISLGMVLVIWGIVIGGLLATNYFGLFLIGAGLFVSVFLYRNKDQQKQDKTVNTKNEIGTMGRVVLIIFFSIIILFIIALLTFYTTPLLGTGF